jgi:RimJ/RimL family protein N-acetyltransferase
VVVVETCAYETERLAVADWHGWAATELPAVVAGMMTPAVTRSLPPDWGGAWDAARARDWIAARDAEGTVLLAVEAGRPVGLVLLYEDAAHGRVSVRLGYLLAEAAWGRGLGGELLAGLVAWSRGQPGIDALVGGVAVDNAASIRLLERSGFVRVGDDAPAGELEYRLDLTP